MILIFLSSSEDEGEINKRKTVAFCDVSHDIGEPWVLFDTEKTIQRREHLVHILRNELKLSAHLCSPKKKEKINRVSMTCCRRRVDRVELCVHEREQVFFFFL